MSKFIVIPMLFLSLNCHSQQLSASQSAGACAGYHFFWHKLALNDGYINDSRFSENIFYNLNEKYVGDKLYNVSRKNTVDALFDALKKSNYNLVKSFAGICNEIGMPIGRNTKS